MFNILKRVKICQKQIESVHYMIQQHDQCITMNNNTRKCISVLIHQIEQHCRDINRIIHKKDNI